MSSGALLDAEILAEVHVAMTRGQESLMIELDAPSAAPETASVVEQTPLAHRSLRIVLASDEECAQHAEMLGAIDKQSKGQCLWLKTPTAPSEH